MPLAPVPPGATLDLGDAAAGSPHGSLHKDAAVAETERLTRRIDQLQEALYAEGRRALLVVLQGAMRPGRRGLRTCRPSDPRRHRHHFKAPTRSSGPTNLWRVPRRAAVRTIGVFTALTTRLLVIPVHDLVPESLRRATPDRAFEDARENGVTVLNFFLHSRARSSETSSCAVDDPRVLEVLGGRPGTREGVPTPGLLESLSRPYGVGPLTSCPRTRNRPRPLVARWCGGAREDFPVTGPAERLDESDARSPELALAVGTPYEREACLRPNERPPVAMVCYRVFAAACWPIETTPSCIRAGPPPGGKFSSRACIRAW